MKKLMSLLMALLLVFVGVAALAETEDDASANDTEAAQTETADTTAETIIGGADGPTAILVDEGDAPSLFSQGLLVTVIGLAGVFLVLILFFLMIKLMGKMLK